MRTLLIYNPVSGRDRAARASQIQSIWEQFTASGHETSSIATTAPGAATRQARAALSEGIELIIACGGDGTVHDVLQGFIDATRPPAAALPILGVIPMGSANVLARHLGLSLDPLQAARQLLTFEPRLIPIGHVECTGSSRYFTVMAGAGPDGALVYRMLPGSKHRLGRFAYYLRAAMLFASHRFEAFDLTWQEAGSATRHHLRASGTMAVRIDDLGGLFSRLAPAARVHQDYMHLIAVRAPGWLSLPAWFASSWLGISRWNPLVQAAQVTEFTCTPAPGVRVHIQADGEWIGTAPATVRLIPSALRLMMPTKPPTAAT